MPVSESVIAGSCGVDGIDAIQVTPPLPSGSAVGIRHFQITDSKRDDISTGKRRFMVAAFYPAAPDNAARQARLVDILRPNVDAALRLLARENKPDMATQSFLFEHLKSLTLRAQDNPAPDTDTAHPVLIYYPGGQGHRLSNAALCEALAARGYVVFALDAPRDAPVVVFPDGLMVTSPAPDDEDYIWPRIADIRYMLDQLSPMNTAMFGGCLDLDRIGVFGHSRGGYLSNICAVEDGRIKTAVNMDGFLWGLWTQQGTGLEKYPTDFVQRARSMKTPILRLRGDQGSPEKAESGFQMESADFGGDFISVALHDFSHGDFSTAPWLCGGAADFIANSQKPVPGAKRVQLLTELLGDFFGNYLKHEGQTRMALLEQNRADMDVFSRISA